MKAIKWLFALVIAVGGTALGAFVGFKLMFVGGLTQAIESVHVAEGGQLSVADSGSLSWGIIRMLIASLVGVIIIGISWTMAAGVAAVSVGRSFRRNRRGRSYGRPGAW